MSLGKRLISTGGVAACTTDSTDPFGDSSGVALYNLDYDASTAPDGTDYSGTPSNVTFGVGGQINYGARFNGSTSYIESGISTDILNSDYTISFWGKSTSSTGIFLNTSNGTTAFVRLDFTLNGDLYFYHRNSSGTAYVDASIVSGMDDGNWHHVVITKDNTNVKAYKDGSLVGTITSTSGTYSNSTTFQFGRNNYNTNGAYNFNGDLDQVRIFNRALDSTEVSTLYSETACVYTSTTDIVNYPTDTTPVAYYKLDNSSEDFSTGGNDGTDTNIEYRFGRFGQAAVFNGSSSAIDGMTNSYVFDNTNKRGSLSFWVNFASLSTTQALINRWDNRSGDNSVWGLWYVNGSDYLQFTHRDSSNNNTVATSNTSLFTINTWHHISLVWNQSTVTFYVDSLEEGTVTNSNFNDTLDTAAGELTFGATRRTSPLYQEVLNGSLDQVRIYSTALSSSQVTELYNEKPETDTSTFKTVLYEGNSSTQYISNVGFQPDLVWVKSRDSASYDHNLYDSVRGVLKRIKSNATSIEDSNGKLSSFDANGFSLASGGDANTSGQSMVAWNWKGGGDAVQNNDGTIQGANCIVSANTDAGFSIVKYNGNGSTNQTIGTGLDNPTELMILKNTSDITDWIVFGGSLFTRLTLNSTADDHGTYPIAFNADTTILLPQQSSQHANIAWNKSGDSYIAYCFHSVSGVSKIGSYTGNGSTSGPIIETGFEPQFVMVKSSSIGGNWNIHDNKRGESLNDAYLFANLSNAEVVNSAGRITFSSNGFQISTSDVSRNSIGATYIYMAFK